MAIYRWTGFAVLSFLSAAVFAHAEEGLELHGFAEGAYGGRIGENRVMGDRDRTLGESRLQLQLSHKKEGGEFYGAFDLLADDVERPLSGLGIREAYLMFGLGKRADVKVGRQTLTWGTGDMLFINDLFPKDYVSFFTGRDDQYLKRSSDAVKLRLFTPAFDVDLVAIPSFTPDLLPSGTRLSHFNPLTGTTVGGTSGPAPFEPGAEMENTELAARLYRYLGSWQISGYLFRGFYKDPVGMDPVRGGMYYPELSAYGGSVRGPFRSGVVSAEYGYYDSREDRSGTNPLVPNPEHRLLLGYERQGWQDFTAGVQYYGEYMRDHDRYLATLPAGAPEFDELRQVLTMRLSQMLHYQTIGLSLFTFYSPTDEDWHLRPSVSYKYSDQVTLTLGGNFFGGERNHTLFGQFEDNSNIYTRFRYSF
ncbi:MAG: porin [Candidatus Latescibacterota bacterium]